MTSLTVCLPQILYSAWTSVPRAWGIESWRPAPGLCAPPPHVHARPNDRQLHCGLTPTCTLKAQSLRYWWSASRWRPPRTTSPPSSRTCMADNIHCGLNATHWIKAQSLWGTEGRCSAGDLHTVNPQSCETCMTDSSAVDWIWHVHSKMPY